MNLDELQSIRDRERQSDSLQQLREDFYVEVGEFVQELRDERAAAAEAADDPFDAPEVNRLSDDINTAEQTVEAVYERRVGKLVKMASFAAADMPTEDEGLTAEERELFERMVAAIEDNRDTVMRVIDNEDPADVPASGSTTGSQTPTEPAADPRATGEPAAPADEKPIADSGGVDAADLMAGSDETPAPPDSDPRAEASEPPTDSGPTNDEPPVDESGGTRPGTDEATDEQTPPDASQPISPDVREDGGGVRADEQAGSPSPTATESATESAGATTDAAEPDAETEQSTGGKSGVDREVVRITADVGQIFGVDEREYELTQEDVVTLPSENAAPLVERDVAERLGSDR